MELFERIGYFVLTMICVHLAGRAHASAQYKNIHSAEHVARMVIYSSYTLILRFKKYCSAPQENLSMYYAFRNRMMLVSRDDSSEIGPQTAIVAFRAWGTVS